MKPATVKPPRKNAADPSRIALTIRIAETSYAKIKRVAAKSPTDTMGKTLDRMIRQYVPVAKATRSVKA